MFEPQAQPRRKLIAKVGKNLCPGIQQEELGGCLLLSHFGVEWRKEFTADEACHLIYQVVAILSMLTCEEAPSNILELFLPSRSVQDQCFKLAGLRRKSLI